MEKMKMDTLYELLETGNFNENTDANGMVIGVPQTFEYFKLIQDRITGFVCKHCRISRQKLEDLMMETGFLTKDVGSILVGEEAVKHGILDEVGGIDRAIRKLREMMDSNIKKDDKAVEK